MKPRFFWIVSAYSLIGGVLFSAIAEAYLGSRIAILGSFAGIQLSHNPGIAFGISLPAEIQDILILTALMLVCIYAIRTAKTKLSQLGFGMIVGGGLANIIDRLPDGLVTDYIQIGSFPIFNVPDTLITVGVGVLLWEMMIEKSQKTNPKSQRGL
ncbi:MAG: signal peptidase II [bacterium]|nr:signal peptidase II [bacterium]